MYSAHASYINAWLNYDGIAVAIRLSYIFTVFKSDYIAFFEMNRKIIGCFAIECCGAARSISVAYN